MALAAASWLAERLVDLLWMGGLGYRAVFWYILELRFGLFAAAFMPLVLAFWLNLHWALRVIEGWRQANGAAIDPVLAEFERSVLLRWALPVLLALLAAIGFGGLWDDAVRFLYGGSFGIADPLLARHDVGAELVDRAGRRKAFGHGGDERANFSVHDWSPVERRVI